MAFMLFNTPLESERVNLGVLKAANSSQPARFVWMLNLSDSERASFGGNFELFSRAIASYREVMSDRIQPVVLD